MAALADLISAEMMAGARTVGRQAEAVSRSEVAARLVAVAAARVLTDRVADGRTMMETGTAEDLALAGLEAPEADGDVEVPVAEGALVALVAQEGDALGLWAPQTAVTTVTGGVTVSDQTLRRSSTGL